MNGIRYNLLYLLWQTFLKCLGYNGITRRVGDFSRLCVAARVVCSVWDFFFDALGNLLSLSLVR